MNLQELVVGDFFPSAVNLGIPGICCCTRTVLMSSSVQKEQTGDYWSHSLKSGFSKRVGKNKYVSLADKLNNECNSYSASVFMKNKFCHTDIIIYGHYMTGEGDCREIYVKGI